MQGAGDGGAGCPFRGIRPGHPEAFEGADGGAAVSDWLQDSHGDVADVPPVVPMAERGEPADGVAEYYLVAGHVDGAVGEVSERVAVLEVEAGALQRVGVELEGAAEARGVVVGPPYL